MVTNLLLNMFDVLNNICQVEVAFATSQWCRKNILVTGDYVSNCECGARTMAKHSRLRFGRVSAFHLFFHNFFSWEISIRTYQLR